MEDRTVGFNARDQAWSRDKKEALGKSTRGTAKGTKKKKAAPPVDRDLRAIAKVTATDQPLLMALKWVVKEGREPFMEWAAQHMPDAA